MAFRPLSYGRGAEKWGGRFTARLFHLAFAPVADSLRLGRYGLADFPGEPTIMTVASVRRAAVLLAATALAPLAQAQAATCPTAGASSLSVGTVASVAPGGARSYSISLGANEGVIVDLESVRPSAAASRGEDGEEGDEHHGRNAANAPRALRLCDSAGALLAPQPGEVFEKGGSVSATDSGERLRFVAPRSGQYIIAVAPGEEPREILARRRDVGTSQSPIISAQLDASQKGIVSSGAPMVYSFAGTAGQWVQLKSTSEKDTVLRLAGPDREGNYSVVAENDDSDGLNPVIRRKLPLAGTYYLQVDSLSDEAAEFDLALARIPAPKPAPPPAALRAGAQVAGRLTGSDDIKLYSLAVVAGHGYRLSLTAPYDGVVAIGLSSPLEPDDGADKPDAGFAEVKSQDANTTGTEKLNFTARSTGQLLVRVKSFGIGDTDGGYTLTVTDQGG
jgi:hypothetical protein